MTAGLERMERSAAAMVRMSLPMMRGDLTAAPGFRFSGLPSLSCAKGKKKKKKKERTHREMSNVFSISHCPVSDLQHVEVIPCTGNSLRNDESSFVHDVCHGAVKAGKLAVPCILPVAVLLVS